MKKGEKLFLKAIGFTLFLVGLALFLLKIIATNSAQ